MIGPGSERSSQEPSHPFDPPASPIVETPRGRRPGKATRIAAGVTALAGSGVLFSNARRYAGLAEAIHRFGVWTVVTHPNMAGIYSGAVFTLFIFAASWDFFRGNWERAVAQIALAVIVSWAFFALGLYSRGL